VIPGSVLAGRITGLLLDRVCPLCSGELHEGPLCGWCSSRLYENPWPHWSGTGAEVLEGIPGPGIPVSSPFLHSGAAREIVIRMKFHGARRLACAAAELIVRCCRELPAPGDVIVPVPLGRRRMIERGFNQSLDISRSLSRLTGARVADVLSRRDDRPQVGLDASARRRNLEGSFRPARSLECAGAAWILDDVITTGSTMDEARKAVRTAFAGTVRGIALTYRREASDGIIKP
jgi:ComF family protein